MISYTNYHAIIDQGSYLCLSPTEFDSSEINTRCLNMGITIPSVEDLHCTLMYSPEVGIPDIPTFPERVYRARLGALALFGERSDYLVVLLEDCVGLHNRHDELKGYGLKSTYPTYRPHITLVDGGWDKKLPRRNLLQGMTVLLSNEKHSPIE